MKPRQLPLVFADSPKGSHDAATSGEPEGKAYVQHIARSSSRFHFTTAEPSDPQGLLDTVASVPNLARALLEVARNKGAAGVDGKDVDEVMAEAHRLLPRLRHELLSERYRPGDIRRVWIPKPGGGRRGLGIPNVVDRWVQQAVRQILEPLFDPSFHDSSHGFRPWRGARTAIAEAEEHLKQGRGWVVSIDLSTFFDRVNHQRLLARLSQRVADDRLLRLVHQMLKAKVVLPDGTCVATEQGTIQGSPLSPLLSNIVLDELDTEIQRRGLRFVRYADDFNVYVRSERAGRRVMASLTRFIEKRLRLAVNVGKSVVAQSSEVDFLGFELHPWPSGKGVDVHLSKRTQRRIEARIRELTPRSWGGSLEKCFARVNEYLRGWIGYFRLCTKKGAELFKRYDAHIRRRIRAIIIRQKKRPRYLFRHLILHGASTYAAARTSWRSCGVWKKSNLPGMTQAYRNAWFETRLLNLWSSWREAHAASAVSGQLTLPGIGDIDLKSRM